MMMDSHTMDLEFRRKTLEIDYVQGKRLCRILYTGRSRAGSVRSEVMETILEALYSGTSGWILAGILKSCPPPQLHQGNKAIRDFGTPSRTRAGRARSCHWPTRRAWRAGGVLV